MFTKHLAVLPAAGFVLVLHCAPVLASWGSVPQPPGAKARLVVTATAETTRLAQSGKQRGTRSPRTHHRHDYGSLHRAIMPGAAPRTRGKAGPLVVPGDIGILPGTALGGSSGKPERLKIGAEH
jgi:hypothetical protein